MYLWEGRSESSGQKSKSGNVGLTIFDSREFRRATKSTVFRVRDACNEMKVL